MNRSSFTPRRLIILNLVWALIALIYDWPKLATIPIIVWPLIAICPLYPALLALTWYLHQRHKPFDLVTAFASLPSGVFGLIALVYYPLYLSVKGFDFFNLLSIPWVWFYAAQGWWILLHVQIQRWAILLAGVFTLTSLVVHWLNYSFGYFDTQTWPTDLYNGFFALAALLAVIVIIWSPRHSRARATEVSKNQGG